MKKPFTPNFKTPQADYCKEEINKLNSNGIRGNLAGDWQDLQKSDIAWESEQLAKSYGIYLEFNRAPTGTEKEWVYLLRICNPGGGPITREQWLVFDELSEQFAIDPQGHSSLRLTTRQTIQFHWVQKPDVLKIVRALAEAGFYSINGCGDNTRNVMTCPLSRHSDVFNTHAWAQKVTDYFQLPVEPYIQIFAIDPNHVRKPEESFSYGPNLLNRKFKIAFSSVHRDPQTGKLIPDNCVELLTHDLSVAPVIENDKVEWFQIYVGGGQGERNGKPAMATLGQPLAMVSEEQILKILDAVVQVQQGWGDRQNRHWARFKYLIKSKGIEWCREQVQEIVGFELGQPELNHDYGQRHLHFGWHVQLSNGLWVYGVFIENGRITDNSPNGQLKTMIRAMMKKYSVELMVTPNQDILFTNIPADVKDVFEADVKNFGYGQRNGKDYSALRLSSGACVGRDTCRLAYTDSEKYEPYLMDELEKMGWGDMAESIGVTGCERQCFRPATKTIGLVGSGLNRYQFKLMGDESGRHQGQPLISTDGQLMYLRSVERDKVPIVIDALFKYYKTNAQNNESMGVYHRRVGVNAIIQYLKDQPETTELMMKTFNTSCVMK